MNEKPAPVPRVAVVGGGIAGMTAALRLAERGYAVTLYEQQQQLGGNLSSRRSPETGLYHDVFPHMFSNFYVNFWELAERDLGLQRGTDFAPQDSFKFIDEQGRYSELRVASDPLALLKDMFSGVAGVSPADLFLYLYSIVDLMATRFEERGDLAISVDSFVQSRPFGTEAVATLHDSSLMFIWSIHATLTAAASYRNFNHHTFGNVKPLVWLLKGPLQTRLIEPLAALMRRRGCRIELGHALDRVEVQGGRAVKLHFAKRKEAPAVEVTDFDHLVLALTPAALGRVADAGRAGHRIGDRVPMLLHAGQRLPSEPIAVMDLYFKRKLEHIPPEMVAAPGTDCYFSFIDISRLWGTEEQQGITALTLSASDAWALPYESQHANGYHLVKLLHRRVGGFDPGRHWGDEEGDIDWVRTSYRSNTDEPIFVNQVGTWPYRPDPVMPGLDNVVFAGDFCRNHVDMATVEAAVTSGINAAAALQQRAPLGEPVVLKQSPKVPDVAIGLLKLALMPAAYAAKAWVVASAIPGRLTDPAQAPEAAHDIARLARLPFDSAADALETWGLMAERGARALVSQLPG